jgi:predicted NAD/FAD-dependent oxidoreductase
MKIIVIGARPAGLFCARVSRERGAEIAGFEAARGVPGV